MRALFLIPEMTSTLFPFEAEDIISEYLSSRLDGIFPFD
jgi:hypothetical protein